MTEVNEARFTIEGTASEDANGDRGYDATNGQTLTCTLEVDPSPALAVIYAVYSAAVSTSPLASKDAPAILWNENSLYSITPSDVNDSVTIDMPATGVHSYVIRCTAITPEGAVIYERIVAIRSTDTSLRKTVPAEAGQYAARADSDDLNEIVDAIESVGATPARPYLTGAFIAGSPTASQRVHFHSFAIAVTFPASLTGSSGKAKTAAAAQTDFDIQKNGVSVGTMRFAAGATVPTFIAALAFSFTAGVDYMEVIAPGTPDATLADISFSLLGTR